MVEHADGSNEMYWIQDDEEGGLCWSPGKVVEVRPKSFVLECIVSGDHFEIEKEDSAVVHPSCLGKFCRFFAVSYIKKKVFYLTANLFAKLRRHWRFTDARRL